MTDEEALREEIETLVSQGDVDELVRVPILVSLDPLEDEAETGWAEGICLRLAHHPDGLVRGNAILGLGHLARTVGRFASPQTVQAAVRAGLCDTHPHVRGHAISAAGDMQHFLGWSFGQDRL